MSYDGKTQILSQIMSDQSIVEILVQVPHQDKTSCWGSAIFYGKCWMLLHSRVKRAEVGSVRFRFQGRAFGESFRTPEADQAAAARSATPTGRPASRTSPESFEIETKMHHNFGQN